MTSKHKALSRRYLTSARKLMAKGDYLRASEKLWGAAAQAVKAYADNRGWQHNGHAELFQVVNRLSREAKDAELNDLFQTASALHTNFNENWLTREQVVQSAKRVEKFVFKIERLLDGIMEKGARSGY